MIVKFHARGKGGGSGPVDYLLGRERNREGATVLQGNPEEVRELIDATPFAKKYTSGVLSFAEKELPPGGREKVMASFERVLMPGLEKNQYSILWVEHQDKGRLELNFVIPNMELQTGKRLQPYYDRADRPRIDAWQTLVNHHYGLHDPNAPENRRTLTLPDNLPETKQALAEGVTRGIDALYHAGEIKGRQDVIQALTEAGLEVVRVTRSCISIADPNGGRNIRLKGAFMSNLLQTGAEFEKKLKERAESTEKMLNDEFRKLEESVNRELTSNESLIRNAINDHTTALKELLERYQKTTVDTMDAHWKTVLKMSVKRWLWLIIVSVLMFATTGSLLWYQGMKINANMNILREQKESLEKLNAKTWGVRYHEDSNGRFLVLPKGMKAETNWTKDNGKLNAVRLVQE